MIIWSDCLIVGKEIEKQRERIKKRLKRGKKTAGIFLITQPSNPRNLFDILDAKELRFSHYKKQTLLVYGMAGGKEEAEELAAGILHTIYQQTGNFNVKDIF